MTTQVCFFLPNHENQGPIHVEGSHGSPSSGRLANQANALPSENAQPTALGEDCRVPPLLQFVGQSLSGELPSAVNTTHRPTPDSRQLSVRRPPQEQCGRCETLLLGPPGRARNIHSVPSLVG
jgi:hypothetical protein